MNNDGTYGWNIDETIHWFEFVFNKRDFNLFSDESGDDDYKIENYSSDESSDDEDEDDNDDNETQNERHEPIDFKNVQSLLFSSNFSSKNIFQYY